MQKHGGERARLLTSYFLLLLLTFLLLVDRGGLPNRAVAVFSPGSGPVGPEAGDPLVPEDDPGAYDGELARTGSPRGGIDAAVRWLAGWYGGGETPFRGMLRAGLPALAAVAAGEEGPGTGPPGLAGLLLKTLTGVSLSAPADFLALSLPVLRQVGAFPPAAGERPEVAVLVPYPRPVGAARPRAPAEDLTEPVAADAGSEGGRWLDRETVAWGGSPRIIIYHTHAREAYLPAMDGGGKLGPEDAFSDDPAVGVLRVGEDMGRFLADRYRVGVIQARQFHDRTGRLGAYVRSEETVRRLLDRYPGISVVLDIHRDSQPRELTTTVVNGQAVARMMVVVGSDQALAHPNWRQNYAFALRLVNLAEEMFPADAGYPGFSRGILPRWERYNQHLSPGALLVEVGGPENTMEEALRAGRLVAAAVGELLARGELPPR